MIRHWLKIKLLRTKKYLKTISRITSKKFANREKILNFKKKKVSEIWRYKLILNLDKKKEKKKRKDKKKKDKKEKKKDKDDEDEDD